MYQQSTTASAIENVGSFTELFSSRIDEGGEKYNRFLFLISTQLPSSESIESFRRAARIKAAFFKPVPKDSLSRDWFIEMFGRKLQRYSDLHRLASYLDVFSRQMEIVTENLRNDLEALELHDLAILDHMRLKADGENLGNYMSWLMSEALAARIRASAPMLRASEEMSAVQRPPFHGMLSPNQVLFSWFSEITFGMLDRYEGDIKVKFGDVYSVNGGLQSSEGVLIETDAAALQRGIDRHSRKNSRNQRYRQSARVIPRCRVRRVRFKEAGVPVVHDLPNQELVLVIAPACDLQRVKCNYEVLCVIGAVVTQTPNLFDLIDQRTVLGKNTDLGKYKHLLQRSGGGKPDYLLVEWYPSNITMVSVTQLQGPNYSHLARLNELFCQEIKEDALRQVGRVGVPVDPAFNVGLGATIAFKPKRKDKVQIEVSDSEMISGLYTSGNANNNPRIIVSEEFIDYFEKVIGELESSGDSSLTEVLAKFSSARVGLLEKGGEGLELSKSQCSIGIAGFSIRYMSEFVRMSGEDGFCGVYFYPTGAIKDPAPYEPV